MKPVQASRLTGQEKGQTGASCREQMRTRKRRKTDIVAGVSVKLEDSPNGHGFAALRVGQPPLTLRCFFLPFPCQPLPPLHGLPAAYIQLGVELGHAIVREGFQLPGQGAIRPYNLKARAQFFQVRGTLTALFKHGLCREGYSGAQADAVAKLAQHLFARGEAKGFVQGVVQLPIHFIQFDQAAYRVGLDMIFALSLVQTTTFSSSCREKRGRERGATLRDADTQNGRRQRQRRHRRSRRTGVVASGTCSSTKLIFMNERRA